MFDDGGGIRRGYAAVHTGMQELSAGEVRTRADYLSRTYVEQGVTFDIGGEERPFPLDIVPRIVDARTWATVEAGVPQRVRALERFLDDVYGPGDLFGDGVMPRTVVTSSPHFHRVVAGLTPPGGVRVHVSGIDLVRDAAGQFRVLEDNVRIPSGVSLRHHQPAGAHQRAARGLRPSPGPTRARLPVPAARRAASLRTQRGGRPDGRGADSRSAQLGIL